MKRPYVICHMMGSVDGRIQTDCWALPAIASEQYEAVHTLHRADAWLCGRETFQGDFLEQKRDAVFSRKVKVPPGDFIAPAQTAKAARGKARPVYAIAVDASGKLRWPSNAMRGDRLVVLTTAQAPSGYLADLRAKSISYLIGGKTGIAFGPVLARLHKVFGLKKIMLEGGGTMNGVFLAAGLIDELSLLVGPVADGSTGTPTVFDTPKTKLKKRAAALRLLSANVRPGGVVWLRYRMR